MVITMAKIRDLVYVAIDLEATYHPFVGRHEIIEIGACKLNPSDLEIDETFEKLVRPTSPICSAIKQKTGITDETVSQAEPIEKLWEKLLTFIDEAVLVDHQYTTDMNILKKTAEQLKLPLITNPVLDTLRLAKRAFPEEISYGLPHLRKVLGLVNNKSHRALTDAHDTAFLFKRIVQILEEKYKIFEYQELCDFCFSKNPLQPRIF